MPRPSWIAVPVLAAWLCGVCPRPAGAADDFAFHHENVMGTALELRVLADDAEAARRAEARVLGEIDRLAAIFSGYDASSEFRRWQAARNGPTEVSPELFEVLRACDRWRAASGGAFDPRVQALSQLWKRLAAQGRTPTAEELAGARALMGRPAWRLDPESRTAECLSDGPLSLDAIAKGYIIERACAVAMAEVGRARPPAERRRRPARLRRRPPDDRDRPREGGLGDVGAVRVHRGPRPGGRHERGFPARAADQRPVVFPHLRPPIGPPRRRGRGRDGHRGAVRRRGRPGDDPQRPPPRGGRPPGGVAPGRRVPDRRGRRAASSGATAGTATRRRLRPFSPSPPGRGCPKGG